jgi:hypothetical protein
VHFHRAADRVGLEAGLARGGPLAGGADQQRREREQAGAEQ